MKILALLLASSLAQAADFTFSPAIDGSYVCPSYCMGFVTSDPAHTVDYINITSGTLGTNTFTVSVDGVVYQKQNAVSPFSVNGATFGINFTTTRTCTHSGRGQTCYTRYHANTGSVSTP